MFHRLWYRFQVIFLACLFCSISFVTVQVQDTYSAFTCSNPTYCGSLPGSGISLIAHCLAFQHFDTATGNYIYSRMECRAERGNPLCLLQCRSVNDGPYPVQNGFQSSGIPLNTNVDSDTNPSYGWDNLTCSSPPGNCNQGFNTNENCDAYIGNPSCSGIPCRCRPNNYYGGNCTTACDGGGGGGIPPTATPTPTPTPFCRLFCPGQEGLIGGLDSQGGGVNQISVQPTPILPTQAVGFLYYYAYNGFQCGAFDDGKNGPMSCPTGSGGTGGYGQTGSFVYPTPTLNPIRYNMLCGGNAQTYTADVTSGSQSTGTGGTGGTPTRVPTAGPSPTLPLYPPGCSLGGPTTTPDPNNPGDSQAGGAKGAGLGLMSGADSCSCSVAVGCQTTLQALPSLTGNSCDSNCDFTLSPETPEYNETITFTTSGTGADGTATLNYDDNTAPVAGTLGARTHTYVNSGVYKVALSCPGISQTCTRDVNVYCGPLSWYKLKNASFHKNNSLNDPIPAVISTYDGDDTGESLVSIGNAGLVTTNGSITTGSGNLSTPNWRTTGYTPNTTFSPTSYADYLVSRKTYATVVDGNSNGVIDSNELTASSINYIVGDYTIDSNSIQSKAPFLLVVRGSLILNNTGAEFNPPDKAITLVVTGTLKIHSHLDTMNGIFIATSVDLAYDVLSSTTTPLKIVGNLISQNSIDLKKRIRTDGSKPSFFVVQDYRQYMKILDKMGVRKYTQIELRP